MGTATRPPEIGVWKISGGVPSTMSKLPGAVAVFAAQSAAVMVNCQMPTTPYPAAR